MTESEPRKRKEKPKRERKKRRAESVEDTPPPPVLVPSSECPAGASDTARRVFAALTAHPQPVDLLAEKAELPIPVLLAALTELEMFGCAANSAGQQYMRT